MTDIVPANPVPARHADGRFGPGNAGRPRGARNRASQRFLAAVFEDFEAHKEDLLQRHRKAFIGDYMKFIAGLLPRQAESVEVASECCSDAEIAQLAEQARALLASGTDARSAAAQLEAMLLCETSSALNRKVR